MLINNVHSGYQKHVNSSEPQGPRMGRKDWGGREDGLVDWGGGGDLGTEACEC